jgi:hypothetical protein
MVKSMARQMFKLFKMVCIPVSLQDKFAQLILDDLPLFFPPNIETNSSGWH